MRIVVWNCGKNLAGKKLKALEDLQPDLAIVPECPSPDRLWGRQPLLAPVAMDWIGDDEHQGLGVLAFNGYRVLRHRAYDPRLRWLLPVEVKGPSEFHLLAVWAASLPVANAAGDDWNAQPLQAIERYREFLLASSSVVAGDFHHNVHGDRGAVAGQQTHLVAGLERLGLASAYHVGRGELHGKETAPTQYGRHRALDAPQYHVDYCLLPLEWCSHLRQVELGHFDAWIDSGLSDHVPLVVDVDLPSRQPATAPRPDKAVRTDLEDLRRPAKRRRKD